MDYPTQPKQPEKETKTSNPLKYTFDGRFSPTTPPDDETPQTTESTHSNSETGQSSGSGYYDPTRTEGLSASLQLIANTMLRMELAELEMMKKRESARLESQKRRAELEDEMIMMILQTQSHIASFVSQNSFSRKRKNSSIKDNSSTSRANM